MLDLIDALERSHNPVEIIELLNNFTFSQEELEEYAVKNNICPVCCADLKLYSWHEPRNEHFGYKANETMSELRCESCNWVKY